MELRPRPAAVSASLLPSRDLLLFAPDLSGGGAERVTAVLAGELARRGHTVRLALAKARGPLVDMVKQASPANPVLVIDLDASRTAAAAPALAQLIRGNEPDVIISALWHANVTAVAARKLAGASVPLIVCEHNSLVQRQALAKNTRVKYLMEPLMRRTYGAAQAVVAVSEGAAAELADTLRWPAERIDVVANPVVDPQLRARAAEPSGHPWAEDPDVNLVVAIGRLTPQKGFDVLIEAMARLGEDHPARLVILGEGDDRPKLQEQIRRLDLGHRVSLPGYVDNPAAYLGDADAFVLSSRYEGLPTVLIEALAIGTPIVATRCPTGPDEILDGGRWGRLVEVENPVAIANALAETLAHGAEPAPESAVAPFTVAAACDAYERVLGRVLGLGTHP